MALQHSPQVIMDGLICLLDSANIKSYPGSGNTWTDLSGNANNATLSNPTYNSTTKAIGFLATGSIGTMSISSINLSSTNNTVMYLSRQTTGGANQLRVLTGISNNWLLGYWSGYSSQYYAEGWVAVAGGPGAETAWSMYTGTGNVSTDKWSIWKNGARVGTENSGGSAGPNGLCINTGAYAERSNCEVSLILVYNRVLTDTEIIQNFNAVRGRYAL
jgi:hypothetical protein